MRRQVITCDRCGFEPRSPAEVTQMSVDTPLIDIHGRPTRNYDLCGSCEESLGRFVRNEPVRCAGPMSCNM
jgi:hypothetical protein